MNTDDARVQRSKRALLDAAIDLLIQSPKASMSEIAGHAGVGRATLYRLFESREVLIQALARECFELTSSIMLPILQQKKDVPATLSKVFHELMPVADRFHFILSLWSIAEKDDQVLVMYQNKLNELHRLIKRGKREESISNELDSDWIICVIDSLIYSGWWMMGNNGMKAEVAAHHAVKTLFHGIGINDDTQQLTGEPL